MAQVVIPDGEIDAAAGHRGRSAAKHSPSRSIHAPIGRGLSGIRGGLSGASPGMRGCGAQPTRSDGVPYELLLHPTLPRPPPAAASGCRGWPRLAGSKTVTSKASSLLLGAERVCRSLVTTRAGPGRPSWFRRLRGSTWGCSRSRQGTRRRPRPPADRHRVLERRHGHPQLSSSAGLRRVVRRQDNDVRTGVSQTLGTRPLLVTSKSHSDIGAGGHGRSRQA